MVTDNLPLSGSGSLSASWVVILYPAGGTNSIGISRRCSNNSACGRVDELDSHFWKSSLAGVLDASTLRTNKLPDNIVWRGPFLQLPIIHVLSPSLSLAAASKVSSQGLGALVGAGVGYTSYCTISYHLPQCTPIPFCSFFIQWHIF